MQASSRKGAFIIGAALMLALGTNHCGTVDLHCREDIAHAANGKSNDVTALIARVVTNDTNAATPHGPNITYPYDETLFPPEIAPPTFEWKPERAARRWLVRIEFADGKPIFAVTTTPRWTPDCATWKTIKTDSTASPATFTVFGFDGTLSPPFRSQNSVRFSTSTDRVDATVLYRQVPLPFQVTAENLRKMKWRLGDIASSTPPPVVMENLPVCASCHSATRDGSTVSMEMNYGEDNGAHLIVPVQKHIRLSKRDFMTWSDFPKPDILPPTRGLSAKISPSGKYLVGTVNEISYSAQTADKAFSQLFFPTYGILAWYDAAKKTMKRLPGADNTDFVQTDPSWRWDEQEIAFARTETRNEYHEDITILRTRVENAGIQALNERFPIQFNLYRIPFNRGLGGAATPIEGASHNARSNYFPRYSPNGKWIVFTQSKSGIMLQPDSELYIVEAKGGAARRMRCNRSRFNSWHSFSPNGKWLLFTSKTNSPYTEIFLTHIDDDGNDTPPVRLSRFSDSRMAVNVPEFVKIAPGGIKNIRLRRQQ